MANLLWRIILKDGLPLRSFEGDEILFRTREEALRWCRPGERVERVKR